MEYLIKTYTNEGEMVLDFTMGSGTTGVAAKNLNRDFIGIEMDEGYFKIAEKSISEAFKNQVEKLIEQRAKAKSLKNWTEADKIREELLEMGVKIKDTTTETLWEIV